MEQTYEYAFDKAKMLFVGEDGQGVAFHPSYLRSFLPGVMRVGMTMGFTREGELSWEYEVVEISTVQSFFGVSILVKLKKNLLSRG